MNLFDPNSLDNDELESGSSFAPRFDESGLIVAIATEASTDRVLMVAYMNRQALQKTLELGDVHYFSRSRQRLWKKGETSGEVQKLIEMRTDCDQDVILLKVKQTGRGAACHTGHKSCFFRRIEVAEGEVKLVRDSEAPLFDPAKVYAGE